MLVDLVRFFSLFMNIYRRFLILSNVQSQASIYHKNQAEQYLLFYLLDHIKERSHSFSLNLKAIGSVRNIHLKFQARLRILLFLMVIVRCVPLNRTLRGFKCRMRLARCLPASGQYRVLGVIDARQGVLHFRVSSL